MTNKNKKRVTIFLTPELLIHAKTQSLVEDLSLTELVAKALLQYLPYETIIKQPTIERRTNHPTKSPL